MRLLGDVFEAEKQSSQKNLLQCHFVDHKSHIEHPGVIPNPTSTTNYLSYYTA
jgi:hypothetical protein